MSFLWHGMINPLFFSLSPQIRDLLSKNPQNSLDLKENLDTGVYVKDLTSFVVKSAIEIDQVMQSGKKNRSVGSTLMNQESSRSHSIFTIICECAQEATDGGKPSIRVGKLNLVDLAGSERQSKTGATGE
jgi:kinesin family protein 3/17